MNPSPAAWPQQQTPTPWEWSWPAAQRRIIAADNWPTLQRLYQIAGVSPSLDLNFARTETLNDVVTGRNLITFARASATSTYVAGDGGVKIASTNQPRFEHNPTTNESLGLLVEELRTNLCLYSDQFDNAAWSKPNINGTIIADQAISPDKTLNADLYQEDTTATTGRYINRPLSTTSGQIYSVSIWAKQAPGATRYLGLLLPLAGFGANVQAAFTLSGAGSVNINISGTNTSASIQAFPNNWYRCILTSQATATANPNPQIRLSNSSANASPAYTGDGSSGLYIWGAQFEAGAFATSYIPTTTATVTRVADVASITGSNFSSWYNQTEGTVFAEGAILNTGGNRFIADITDSGINEEIGLYWNTVFNSLVIDNNTTQANSFGGTITANNRTLHSFGYKLNDFQGYGNAVALSSDTAGTLPTVDRLTIGSRVNSTFWANGTIKRLTYWPTRLANNTLQQITR
jgi:hypothetical protein